MCSLLQRGIDGRIASTRMAKERSPATPKEMFEGSTHDCVVHDKMTRDLTAVQHCQRMLDKMISGMDGL